MKKKALKLNFSKETIAKLSNQEMNIVKGGDTIVTSGTITSKNGQGTSLGVIKPTTENTLVTDV